MIVKCAHCENALDFRKDVTGRCPTCGSVFEIYYDWLDARHSARVYNELDGPPHPPAKISRFRDLRGWVVFYRDGQRLVDALKQRMREEVA